MGNENIETKEVKDSEVVETKTEQKSTLSRVFDVIMAVLYGVAGYYFLFHPVTALTAAAIVFIIFFIAAGIVEIIHYFLNRQEGVSIWMLILGIINVVLGVYILLNAVDLITLLPQLVAIWALLIGISRFVFAFTQKNTEHQWISSLVTGIVLFILGVFMLLTPVVTIVSLGVLFGIVLCVLAVNNLIEAFTK